MKRLDGISSAKTPYFSPLPCPPHTPVRTAPSKAKVSPRRTRRLATGLAILLGATVILAPLLPQASFFVYKHRNSLPGLSSNGAALRSGFGSASATGQPIPDNNTLVIPAIGITGEVHEGTSSKTLLKGIWHRPGSSTPDKGGNTVLTAHRFMYTFGQNTFYHLDKLKEGDVITVYWNRAEYRYKVNSQRVVTPNATAIEQPTVTPTLTLYTCTPLWTSKNRLIVQADLVSSSSPTP